ncbi:two-component system response regulator [Cyanobacterium sp. DS4]|uniref:two-component system response regulator n=1 Tax=Cyanobacterium sp. DS4 TaxID=2878255 RepID=UPI002E81E25E|nr:EAL domain-containing protein [Cyanobacterium sp. Dongsha4]WVL01110.1 EAL domain-containing protein [Cyanobacterium sp. Dongsha4]
MNIPVKIFIIEDEVIAAESLKLDLENLGYQVIGKANSQEKVLPKIKENRPDLILMDIRIKGDIDGIELAKKINQIICVPVIYLTAYADEKTLNRAMETSPYGYIVKPYKTEDLATTIRVALQKYNQINHITHQLTSQQERLNFISKYDELTQLPNQLSLVENFNGILELFYQKLNSQVDLDIDNKSQFIPLLYLNFGRFYLIRDELGQDLANMLFKALVKRLKANLNEDYILTRLDGDDFALIVPPIKTKQIAIDLATNLLEKITPPFIYKQQEIYIDFKIGISLYPIHGENIDQLLYKAKEAVKDLEQNQYKIYSPAFHSFTAKQVSLEAKLHNALNNQELEIYYQPLVEMKTNKIFGAEALLRWNNPEDKYISPEIFIPLAEEIGIIETINDWILNTACEEFNYLHKNFKSDLQLSINLSKRQFDQDYLEQKILKILADNYFNPSLLQIEISENFLVNNHQVASRKLKKLHNIGLKIAIDDFGTGYSSLGYLQNLDFDILKLDRIFINKIENNQKNATITKSLIEMAHELNLKIIAEGVETEPELSFLHKNNCDYYQGYLFSRALPFQQFKELLEINI